jgi:hypothetical protein
MKISFYYFIIPSLFLVFGCNKNEVIESDEGLILGEWEGSTQTMVIKDGTSENWVSGLCQGNIIHFKEDGKLFYIDWVQDEIYADNCNENEETPRLGRWERISNKKYRLTLIDESSGKESIIEPELITFESDNPNTDVMQFRYKTLPDNAPEGAQYYYLDLFRR